MNQFKLLFVLLFAGSFNLAYAQSLEQQILLQELATQLKQKSQAEKAEAVRVANEKGWAVRTEDENGRITELMRLDENGMPMYYTTYNAEGAALINSDELYNSGAAELNLSGAGQTLGIWDGGDIRTTHLEFGGRITDKDGVSPDGIANHPTHVAGTLIASGVEPLAKGMSFAASLDAYDWDNDWSEMTAAAADGLKVSQHSYGLITGWAYGDWYSTDETDPDAWHWFGDYTIDESEDYYWGYYSTEARYWDYIAQISPNYLIVKSAGNDRGQGITSGDHYAYNYEDEIWEASSTSRLKDGGTTGYHSIAHSALSKNVLSVGAVHNSTAMSSFSGWGPTDDGRIKPDIVAKGVSVYSTLANANNNSYDSWQGTSMSGPMVSGSVGLLLEHQENLHPGIALRSATMKGLILHTATDLGNAGPDYVYGWGLMNTQAAAEVMTDNASGGNHIVEASLSNGATKTYYIEATGGEPVVATIIWTDPYGAVPTPSLNPTDLILVNDLDMQIEDASSTVFNPYILDPANPGNAATTGDNIRDNIEKIVIASPTAGGVYALTISHKATLNDGSQDYSLIITGNTSLSTTTTLPYAETFDTDLGDCYTYSVSGATKNWYWQDYNGNGFAKMNGYNSGDTEEDWLILPGINADDYTTITMNFETAYNFGTDDADNYLKLFYSTDYNGVGDPSSANWTELAFTQPGVDGYVYVNSGDIDLSAISGQFYLAFKYRGTDGNYRTWQIDNINIFQELITFYFRGPNWMDNNPHDPQIWGPFNGWSGAAAMTYDNDLEWWKTTIEVADPLSEIEYQARFSQDGQTKYQKAFGNFSANPTFTTTSEIWIDASEDASFAWDGNDFYLAEDKITEEQPVTSEPADFVTNLDITVDSESQISLSWTDSDAAYYLIKGSAVGYADISNPIDGTAEADALLVKNVGSTIQNISFGGLDVATTYYFKIFPYNGIGSTINFKTDGTVPQESATTNAGPPYYYAGLEGDGETKTAYASGTVTISNVEWNLTEALIGESASDYKTGVRSVRMRGYGTSAMTMLEDKANGIGSIYFNYRRYGTDQQVDWKVEYSLDGGSNWTQIGSTFTAPASDEVQTFHEKVNMDGNVRIRIKRVTETGSTNRRLNIDDMLITDYNKVTFLADMSLAEGFDAETDDVYLSGNLIAPEWGEPGTNSNALFSRLGPTNTWVNVLNLSELQYEYKLFKNTGWGNGEWDGNPNRKRTVSHGEIVTELYSYVEFSGNGAISDPSNWAASTIPDGNNIMISGTAQLNQALVAESVIIEEGGSITIPPLQDLTVNNTLTNNAGAAALLLQSDANGTGSLIHSSADVPATIQRYINGGGYHLVSVPINGALTAGLFMHSYLYYFDATADPQDWDGVGEDPEIAITNNQGYMIWFTGNNTTYDFEGALMSGDFVTATPAAASVYNGSYNEGGYNLVPNPYPSAIDWNAEGGFTENNLFETIWIYNRDAGNYGAYVRDAVSGTNEVSNIIPVGQSFFVQASNAGSGSLTIKNEARTHSANNFLKEPAQIAEMLRLHAAANNLSDELLVQFNADASPTFEGNRDAQKMRSDGEAPQLFSLSEEGTELSINTLPYRNETIVIPIGFELSTESEVSFNFTNLESFSPLAEIYLEDLLSGQMINLREQQEYSFTHATDNDPLRFRLHFKGVVGLNEQAVSGHLIWSYDDKVYVSIPALTGEKAIIQLVDMQGKMIYQGAHNLSNPEIITVRTNQHVLVARIIAGNQVFTNKVFIR